MCNKWYNTQLSHGNVTSIGTLQPMDDAVSSPISISTGFPFGDSVQTEAYVSCNEGGRERSRVILICLCYLSPMTITQVSTNGYIVFGRSFIDCCPGGPLFRLSPDYIIAPFWSDADPSQSGLIKYSVFEGSNSTEIRQFSRAISGIIGSNFFATWMMIADWVEVPQFGSVGDGNVVSLLHWCMYKRSDRSLFVLRIAQSGNSSWFLVPALLKR